MVDEEDIATAWDRIRVAMAEAGLALISTDALKEGWGTGYTGEAYCPYCFEWNTITFLVGEDDKIMTCCGCGKRFRSQHVEYLTSEEL